MKKILFFTIALIFAAQGENVLAEEIKTPEVNAKGAILMEFDTGRVLYEKDADMELANASTTKIMTAIVALENCGLSDIVTASAKAAGTAPVKMHLQKGEKQRLEDLLYALMLESSNDAAVAIAEHVGGSVEGFAQMMNKKAKEIGAVNTEFVTPNGLDEGNHHSTARDMALIARYALGNKHFRDIISTKSVVTPIKGGDYKQYSFTNKDRLLSEYEGAIGIKTGYTGAAGHCFVGAAKRDGMLLISVVLGSGWGSSGKEQKWTDTKRLLNYGFDNYKYVKIIDKGAIVKTYDVLHSKGKSASAYVNGSLALPLKQDEMDSVEIVCHVPNTLDAPVGNGEKLGVADVFIKGEKSAEIDIVADRDIDRIDFSIMMGKLIDRWINVRIDEAV